MSTARELYQFLWDKIPPEDVTHPTGFDNRELKAQVFVTDENLDFLKECEANSVFKVANHESICVGAKIEILRTLENPYQAGVFFNDNDALLSPDGIHAVEEKRFYIGSLNFDAATDDVDTAPNCIRSLFVLSDILAVLKLAKYWDKGSSLVFFGKESIELDTKIDLGVYNEGIINILASDRVRGAISEFRNWFEQGESSVHRSQKKAIINNHLYELLWSVPASSRFSALVSSIEEFSRQSMKSYELYLEEFSYSKFSKKLEEKQIAFYEKISKSVLDVKNQIISLPVSFILLSLIREHGVDAVYVVAGMTVYCLILFILLHQQKVYLGDIREEIEKCSEISSNVGTLKKELSEMNSDLLKRVNSHSWYINFFYVLVFLALIASWYQYKPDTFDPYICKYLTLMCESHQS